jgi:hypothetical protein
LRKLSRRETALVVALGLAAVAAVATLLRRPAAASADLRPSPKSAAPLATVPRIDLARLAHPPGADEAGRRDLFAFGERAEPPPAAPLPRVEAATPAPGPLSSGGLEGVADTGLGNPSLPPLNLRYIGSVESARGVKVAVLLTDKREVLTGQAGEVVANRYRIARIGLESVDLEDVGTGQSRRIPLRGGS